MVYPLITKKISLQVDYEEWTKSVLRFDQDYSSNFDKSLIINGNVKVVGDVKVSSINGLDVRNIYENAAKKSSSFQTFKGKFHS